MDTFRGLYGQIFGGFFGGMVEVSLGLFWGGQLRTS